MIGLQELFILGIILYIFAALLSIILDSKPHASNICQALISCFASVLIAYVSSCILLLGKILFMGPYVLIIPEIPLIIQIDSISAVFIFAISTLSMAISIFTIGYLRMYYHERSTGYFGLFYNIFILSMILTCAVAQIIWFLLFWELMTASSYFLVIYEDTPDVRKIGFLYFIMMHIGFACIAISLAIVSFAVGSMEFSKIMALSVNINPVIKMTSLILALIGFGMKLGMFPFHIWLPEAHPAAPSNVSALLSGVMLSVGLYGLTRISIITHAHEYWWYLALIILGLMSVFIAFLCMPAQIDFKRLLAYSSIAEMGLATVALGYFCAGSSLGLQATLMHVINQAFAKGMLFAISGLFIFCAKTRHLRDIKGLRRVSSIVATFYAIAMADIMGLPPFGCFFSKVFIILAGFSSYSNIIIPISAAITLTLEILCFVWFLRIMQYALMGEPSKELHGIRNTPASMYIGLLLLAIFCIISGPLSLHFIGKCGI